MVFVIGKSTLTSDLKPENFLFLVKENEKVLKLIDFGLSKRFNTTEMTSCSMESEMQSPIRKTSSRKPKKEMNTRAGTVGQTHSSPSTSPRKSSRETTTRSATCGLRA